MSASQNPRKRIAFTDIDRQCLRVYNRCNPGLTPPQLASWFESEFDRKVSNSSVYDILSDKYAHLDNVEATEAVRKKKGPQWAELEKVLFEWWQNVQPRDVTGRELKVKAIEIWRTLPACQGKKPPTFSDGWLSNWRVRHGLGQLSQRTEFEQTSSGVEVLDREMLADSVSGYQQSIAYPPCAGLMLQAAIMPPVQPHESRLYFDRLNVQISSNQPRLAFPFHSTSPSIAKFFPMINSPNQGKRKQRSGELVTNAQHKAKRVKIMAKGQSDITKSGHVVSCSVPALATIPTCKTPWQGIQELVLNDIARNTDGQIIAGDTIKERFQPIIDSLKGSMPWLGRKHFYSSDVKRALLLFAMAENFQLQQVRDDTKNVILEEWFLDTINPKILRSRSPERYSLTETSSSSCNLAAVIPSRSAEELDCLTTFASLTAEGGKVSVLTRKSRDPCDANNDEPSQHLQAKIVITPPVTSVAVSQTEIHLATHERRNTTTLLTPIISFRNIIPMDSTVFRVAAHGTSLELQMILSKGDASLTDCDPAGRSLINYALQSMNYSTLKFLITKVGDIDALEPMFDDGSLAMSLFSLLLIPYSPILSIFRESDTRLECTKLMLLAEADPFSKQPGFGSAFDYSLVFGSAASFKAILDSGHPYITNDKLNVNTSVQPLSFLLTGFSLHLHEKNFLILERSANIALRDLKGATCLHLVFGTNNSMSKYDFRTYREEEFKDILMCMVTAGANVYASDDEGTTISQVACRYSHEGLWIEVLAECGYDPDEVFSLKGDFSHGDLLDVSGLGIFSTATPAVRSARLSFAEYSQQRKSLQCVQNVYSRAIINYREIWRESDQFWESYIESSDSDDEESDDEDSDDEDSDDEESDDEDSDEDSDDDENL